ncbi:MAG: addiction module toxin, HicA family [Candidatus Yonathbacteria bacterium CG10_big_fil_rev_8_21_14_0_10_43_136]|uniref:Addiction module toxin, HicA family n=1 Tax=Candidatus Yonathbacteria bacterium CG_4_10_14_0_8_um_filter_43_17 TaxID=1975099 RepID=A0A2M7Q4Z6_9BACT|nr:MAG: addiction module toxin, HicA family [Candidatus Yonathbacteria bacterium CG10_big_fil_rev_8_21_14_0_10_43_136]PIX57054.1 MAG: addiction module toxin, HicA family [Candidatus Yonathbacteria bacterium CG_4_10_14_3_um_filter_43_12]PIY58140.1 MAG: addiction module toxin, HicA family [Candidatus Yonathbacteria bacterium CG_4_10_14_0_8_um_filter_43_17]PJC22066.1 MAG: addiction module toxin, HicA family [Candidatus Yonathbacteria bacterium CG_4_9_14_0_2_um_filter_43_16]
MKRLDFIKHLNKEGCTLAREGASHSVFFNAMTRRTSTVPRHTEIDNNLAQKISRDLGIPRSPKR